ncbi:heterokaryon incompatibility protein-domain-containing protein [Diplogelasinospora grovesii]|uniref:Heterokaryon incompatibility protein-domain-containing protein n=1 Tax=Diplogelasinospora grovesii TaxID=303347 RepID=A0AAN6NDJ0_9PEZI|nr:heterokaryon incompatibility protein-domain-containing protein [Diplogelasinospora grovesii]
MPPFPAGSTQVSSFRLIRQSWLQRGNSDRPCTHFVAVSYCWPQDQNDQSQGRYEIREIDGRTRRKNRAPEGIIDRAVAFARESGCRFIWIDQECIDQENAEEKGLAVASMDLVYSRAHRSVALLDSVIHPETHLHGLSALCEWDQLRRKQPKLIGSRVEFYIWSQAEQIVSLLEMVSHEKWSTRAWVLQEAFSAGSHMSLLLRKPADLPPITGLDPDLVRLDLSMTEIALDMDTFARCVDWARELFTQRAPLYAREADPTIDAFAQRNRDRICNLFDRLRVQFASPPSQAERAITSTYRLGYPKRSCNAAAALSFLRHRENSVISDRASIFANLCDYDYRLDMAEVCRRDYPLSACILALSILNGDYSLLIPEVYKTVGDDGNGIDTAFQRIFPSQARLQQVDYFVPNPATLIPPQVKHHFSVPRQHALAFPACLWKVHKALDVEFLRERHGRTWTLIMFYTAYFGKVEQGGQAVTDFIRPWVAFFNNGAEHPVTFNEVKAIVSQISNSPDAWKPPYDVRALKIETFALHCCVLLDLILALRDQNELGLADAVWNSIQALTWPIDGPFKGEDDVPASVAEFPAAMPVSLGLLTIDTLFTFDHGRQGKDNWLQSWLVGRVMTTGKLWYGNLVQTSGDDEWPASSPEETTEPVQQESSTEPLETASKTLAGKGRYYKQLVTSMLTHKIMNVVVEEAGHKPDRNLFTDDPGGYLHLILSTQTSKQERKLRLRDSRAFFDVDEPCLVATPYNTRMDMLPRPDTRAMSVSWVVRPLQISSPEQRPEDYREPGRVNIDEAFQFVRAVRGMWAVGLQFQAMTRYAVSFTNEDDKGS